jgi:lipoyl(octanoyl) transferase
MECCITEHINCVILSMNFEISNSLVEYPFALEKQQAYVEDIINNKAEDLIWLLEHPPLYTSGTSAKISDLLDANKFPIFEAGRGGQYTYHGPGQRIAYIMLNLKNYYKQPDLRRFVSDVEQVIIDTIADFGIEGFRREGRVGIWVQPKNQPEAKIAAIGIRVRKWVSFHGLSINLNPDLSHFNGIVPCGLPQFGVTSLHELGVKIKTSELDDSLAKNFKNIFNKQL